MKSARNVIFVRHFILVVFLLMNTSFPLGARNRKSDTNKVGARTAASPASAASDETALLKQQLAQQQARIDLLEQTLANVTKRLDQLDRARSASSVAPAAGGQVSNPSRSAAKKSSVPTAAGAGLAASAGIPPTLVSAPRLTSPELNPPKSSPLAFKIGDAEITPGGFMDFTNVFRSTNLGSGVATSFGTIPYSVIGGMPNTPGRMTEFRSLAQNSRISMKVTSKVAGNNITGYVEGDFAGNNPSSLFVTSNSSTPRLRLYFAQIERGKFELVAGQSWSLLTPSRTGISPWPTDLFISQVQDSNYQLGITWGRQSQLRMVYHPNKQWAMALSIENPNQYMNMGVVLPGTNFNSQFDMAGNQTATPNLHPDVIAKVTYDPMVAGKHIHAELAGIVRSFRAYNSNNNSTSTITGGGVTAGLNLEVLKNFHLMAYAFSSDGGGRYILGLGPDVIVKPDGTLSGVHAASVVTGFEYQMNPRILLFGYYGGAYFQRNTGYTLDAAGKPVWVGFGAPANSTYELNANRAIQEPTFGVTRTFWKNPRFGSLLWVNQYSYVTRAPWIVPTGAGKNAHLGVVYTDLRYVLP